MVREFVDARGTTWEALGVEEVVAHAKRGVRLAFRLRGEATTPPLPAGITFNSREAADFALRTLGLKELQRRLSLAQAEAGTLPDAIR